MGFSLGLAALNSSILVTSTRGQCHSPCSGEQRFKKNNYLTCKVLAVIATFLYKSGCILGMRYRSLGLSLPTPEALGILRVSKFKTQKIRQQAEGNSLLSLPLQAIIIIVLDRPMRSNNLETS